MKKRKNRLLYGALSGAFCFGVLCFAGGCGLKLWEPPSSSSSSVSDSSSSDSSVEASEYLINGFNCMDDLYAVKPIGVEPTDAFVMDVNTRPEFVSEGKGSLVYQNVAGAYHEVFLLFENTAAADMDTQKISAVSVDVYNPNAETVGFSLLMKTYDGSTLFVEQANIAPNTWTTVRIDLTGYSYAQKEYIDGVSMRFDVDSPNTFYVDKIHAEMGATDLPPVDLNAVLQTISVPQGVERITEENFGEHVAFVEKVFYAKRLYDEDASGVSAENSKKLNDCLALMTDFAVLYDARTDFVYKGHYGSNLTVLSSEDTTYGAVWSISVPKTKKE